MRCGPAQRLMVAAVDRELAAREQEALDRHLATCAPCQREMAATGSLLTALESLPLDAPVSVSLEQAMLRRVRQEGDEGAVRRRWWASPMAPVLALAATVVLALSVALLRNAGETPARVAAKAAARTGERVARVPAAPAVPAPATAVARAGHPQQSARSELPLDPPPALAAAPELFMDLPILRHLEKLEHFEAIRTTTLDQPPAADERPDEQG